MFTKKKEKLWSLDAGKPREDDGITWASCFQSAAPVTTGKTWRVKWKLRRTRTYHGQIDNLKSALNLKNKHDYCLNL